MHRPTLTIAAMLALLGASSALAQSAPAQAIPATPASSAPAVQDWNPVSRSATRVYLVDANSIKANGDVSSINLARVPVSPPTPTDHSYTLVEMEFRCAAKQSRAVSETDHDETGAALDRYETGEEFASFPAETLDAYIASVVCDGDRAAPPTFPSITAFIDAGRPAPRS